MGCPPKLIVCLSKTVQNSSYTNYLRAVLIEPPPKKTPLTGDCERGHRPHWISPGADYWTFASASIPRLMLLKINLLCRDTFTLNTIGGYFVHIGQNAIKHVYDNFVALASKIWDYTARESIGILEQVQALIILSVCVSKVFMLLSSRHCGESFCIAANAPVWVTLIRTQTVDSVLFFALLTFHFLNCRTIAFNDCK